ncbi:MAG: FtsX-like permease family protein [Pseudomonadota bacterium]
MRQGLFALLSHWWRNPWQLLTLITGLALATALWSGVQAINAEARASYAAASATLEGADLARLTKVDGSPITTAEFVALRRAGWLVSPLMEARLDAAGGLHVVGLDPLTLPASARPNVPGRTGGAPFGGLLSTENLLLVHPDDVERARALNVTVESDRTRRPGTALADVSTMQTLVGADARITAVLMWPVQPFGQSGLPAGFSVSEAVVQADVARLTRSFHLNLTAFGLLSFAVGIFIVYGTIGLAFEQRRAMFRTLRALGLPLRRLMLLLSVELFAFALVAGALGVALGYVLAAALLPDVAATLRGLYGAQVSGQLQLRPVWWLSGLGMALAGTGLAGAAALFKLATMPLLSFNHPRAMAVRSAMAGRGLAASALALFAMGISAVFIGDGLVAGFVLLGCLLVGAALLLPVTLAVALSIAERASQGVIAQWFWADSRQQLPGLAMALMALMLAMAANIGVSTMVSSFRATFTGYLDQRLASELYIAAGSEAQAREIEAFLEPQVETLLPVVSVDVRIGGLPAEIFALRAHRTYRQSWPVLQAEPAVWDQLFAGQGALVNEQLARRQNYQLGDRLPSGDRIVGIYSDYGNAAGQVLIGEALFQQRYPDHEATRFGVRTDRAEEITEALYARFELSEEAVIDQASLKAFSLQVFERTFAVTAALNALTLAVAGLAILISLLTLATMRLPQLAPVWALGLTRRRLAELELLRALCLAVLTAVLALPLGLALAWVLLAVVNVEAFGWRLPMFLFPMDYLHLGAITTVAAVLAALWPAVRLARTPPQSLLKVFSNDR